MNTNVLEFWHAVEALTPQDAVRVNENDLAHPVYGIHNDVMSRFPWDSHHHAHKPIDSDLAWAYEAQCGIYDTAQLSALLVSAIGHADSEELENKGGTARVFDLRFDDTGLPLVHTFKLSLAAWASGQLLSKGASVERMLSGCACKAHYLPEPGDQVSSPQSGFQAFDRLSMGLIQWIANEVERFKDNDARPGVAWLSHFVDLVAKITNLPPTLFGSSAFTRIRCTRVRRDIGHDKGDFMDSLGSFYAADLHAISHAVKRGEFGTGMLQFMSGGNATPRSKRVDVRDPASNNYLADALAPSRMPIGRWPSDHALAFSQQFAVNEVFAKLENNAGLFAVNGPPGTGKTTLLRDIVAGVVTKRAQVLVDLGAKAFASKSLTKLGDVVVPFYPLHAKLSGHSIVVATENNGAAENVTRELPGLDAVPARVAEQATYFHEIANVVAGKAAWGLIAAPLGNRRNRSEFVSRFWWGDRSLKDSGNIVPMRAHLKSLVGSESIAARWVQSIERFKLALKTEKALRNAVEQSASLPAKIADHMSQVQSAEAAITELQAQYQTIQRRINDAEATLKGLRIAIQNALEEEQAAQQDVLSHKASKPSAWRTLISMGSAVAQWRREAAPLWRALNATRESHAKAQADAHAIEIQLAKTKVASNTTAIRLSTLSITVQKLRTEQANLEANLHECVHEFGTAWLDIDADPDSREHVVPWGERRWLAAREEVFLAALGVHKAFIESHPVEMGANLALANDWLSGKRLSPELVSLALESLCMVVPVVSATFASIPRMFATAKQETIGWLLIDEAGQAQSPHAACAVWRARRTVMVGDPLQLEPVFTLPQVVESELAAHFGVEQVWMPSWYSAQALADQSSLVGTRIRQEDGQSQWVGCPLRLHRRCAHPMFDISNQIAYGGMMVYGKRAGQDDAWPQSAWLDVKAGTSEGHWIDADGERLKKLLVELLGHGVARDQIAMISPFRDCAKRLRRIAKVYELDPDKSGTIHTAQGKEADVVIVVLGGNPKSTGAKAWAASKPNLLNVAVSRGKKRLYVIGDVGLWRRHNHFSAMAGLMSIEGVRCS